jgi:hypothetical protein
MATRTSIRSVPDTPKYCLLKRPCPYRDQQILCDDPQINKGNSDSACHSMTNKRVIAFLSNRQDGEPQP